MIELSHLDVHHFVIKECCHLANGCIARHQFDTILLSIICLGAIICDINTIGFVSVTLWLQVVNHSPDDSTAHETKWTLHVKRRMTRLMYASSACRDDRSSQQ